jgi:hypothetical protein
MGRTKRWRAVLEADSKTEPRRPQDPHHWPRKKKKIRKKCAEIKICSKPNPNQAIVHKNKKKMMFSNN